MAGDAIFFVILGDRLPLFFALKEGPTPAIAPQRVVDKTACHILDYNETTIELVGAARQAGEKFFGRCHEHVFDQNAVIGKAAVKPVPGDGFCEWNRSRAAA